MFAIFISEPVKQELELERPVTPINVRSLYSPPLFDLYTNDYKYT